LNKKILLFGFGILLFLITISSVSAEQIIKYPSFETWNTTVWNPSSVLCSDYSPNVSYEWSQIDDTPDTPDGTYVGRMYIKQNSAGELFSRAATQLSDYFTFVPDETYNMTLKWWVTRSYIYNSAYLKPEERMAWVRVKAVSGADKYHLVYEMREATVTPTEYSWSCAGQDYYSFRLSPLLSSTEYQQYERNINDDIATAFGLTDYSIELISVGARVYSNGSVETRYRIDFDNVTLDAVDNTPPSVVLNSPSDSYSTEDTTINFNWTATDNHDNSLLCNLTIDGVVNASNIASTSGSPTTYSVSDLPGGTHYWNVTCWDDDGNVNTSETRSFTVTSYTISSCTNLNESGATYKLTADIINSSAERCMNITANDITLDCQGHLIDGTKSTEKYGIYVAGVNNTVIKNCRVEQWDIGVRLHYYLGTVNNITLDNVTVTDSLNTGLSLYETYNSNITNSNFSFNGHRGVVISDSDNNYFSNNVINNNTDAGVYLSGADYNNLSDNEILGNGAESIYVSAAHNNFVNNEVNTEVSLTASNYNEFSNLTIDSSRIKITSSDYNNFTNINITNSPANSIWIYSSADNNNFNSIYISNAETDGILVETSSHNNNFNNLEVTNCGGKGISLSNSDNIQITNSDISSNNVGIYINSAEALIENNTVNSNTEQGIYGNWAKNPRIISNTINNNGNIGIYSSAGNESYNISYNTISGNYHGIALEAAWDDEQRINGNYIYNNTIKSNTYRGIRLVNVHNNTIVRNTIVGNPNWGIALEGVSGYASTNNTIYDNFFNNTGNVGILDCDTNDNIFNTTKNNDTLNIVGKEWRGGNYWAKPDGTGFSETCWDTDGDWICEDSLDVYCSNNKDYLPLTLNQDFTNPSVSFVDPTPANNEVVINFTINVTATDDNAPIINCTLEFDGTNESMTMVGSGTSVSCYKDKNGLAEGTYTYKVYVENQAHLTNVTETRTVKVDLSPPSVKITSPAASSWHYQNFDVDYNITDTNIDTCKLYTNDNGAGWVDRGTITCGANTTTITVAAGGYCSVTGADTCGVRIWANDTVNNINTTDRYFSISAIFDCVNLTSTTDYHLRNSITDSSATTCININADGATLNCDGYTIDGIDSEDTYGIYSNKNNTKIKNCILTDWYDGIKLENNRDNDINDTQLSSNKYGIQLVNNINSDLFNITANNNEVYGIYFYKSYGADLINSTIKNSGQYDTFHYVTANAHCVNTYSNVKGTDDKDILYYNGGTTIQNNANGITEIILCNADNSIIDNVTMSSGTDNNGIILIRTDNTNLTNLDLTDNYYGIYLKESTNNNLINITASNNDQRGIYLLTSSDNNHLDNITANNNIHGIYLSGSDNNTLSNIVASFNTGRGLSLYSVATSNIVEGITTNNNTDYGIYIFGGSDNNQFSGITSNSNSYNVYIDDSAGNFFKDGDLSNGNNHDVRISVAGTNNIFLNTTYSTEYVCNGCELIRKWYLDARVRNLTGGNVENANVTGWDTDNIERFSELTNSNGRITQQNLTQYINNGTEIYYWTPYSVNAKKTGILDVTQSTDLTTNVFLQFDPPPEINVTSPSGLYYVTSLPKELDLNYTVNHFNISQCWYNTDYNSTNVSLPDCNNTKINVSVTGTHTITVYANSTTGSLGSNSSTFTIAKDLNVDLITPADNYSSPTENVTFGCNSTIIGWELGKVRLQIWNSTGLYYENNKTISGSQNYTEWYVTNMPDDDYKWTCTVWDSSGNFSDTATNRTLYIATTPPTVNIIKPISALYYDSSLPVYIELNYTATHPHLDSCWYHTSLNSTNITLPDCNSTIIPINIAGTQTVTVYANNTAGVIGSDTSDSFVVAVNLTTELITPAQNYISPSENVTFGCNSSIEGTQLRKVILYVYKSDGSLYYSDTVYLFDSQEYTEWTVNNMPDDFYNWTCQVFEKTESVNYTAPQRTVKVLTSAPIVNIESPTGIYDVSVPATLDLNYTAIHPTLESCWYSLDGGANTSLPSCANTTITVNDVGYHTITVYANNSQAYIGSDTNAFFIASFETEYEPEVTESQLAQFNFTFATANTSLITNYSAHLIYNGTDYGSYDSVDIQPTEFKFTKNIYIPLVENKETFKNFYWNYSFNGAEGQTSEEAQLVRQIILAECNATYSTTALRFLLKDEETLSSVVGQQQATFNIWVDSPSIYRTYSFDRTGNSTYEYCIYPSNAVMRTNMNSVYSAENYSSRSYYLTNAQISNQTNEISLYLILESKETSVWIHVQDNTFNDLPNVIVKVLRYYPSTDEYKTVQIEKTDTFGRALTHLVEEDVDYKFILEQNGSVIYQTEPMRIMCLETPCQLEFTVSEEYTGFEPFPDVEGLSYNLEYNENNSYVTLTWSDSTGLTQEMELVVTKEALSGSTVVCDKISSATAGTLVCDLTNQSGTFVAKAYRTASPKTLLDLITITLKQLYKIFGTEAILLSWIMIISLILIGIWQPSVSIGLGIFGMIVLNILGWINITFNIVIAFIVIALIVMLKVRS